MEKLVEDIMRFLFLVLEAGYFFLPAYVANMMPVLVKNVSFLDFPISGKYLGTHKTYRGLVAAVIGGIVVSGSQFLLYRFEFFFQFSLFNYEQKSFLLLGFLLGFGAIFGDALKSFFKRRIGIGSGKPWFPFDQLDFVVVGLLFSSLLVEISWFHVSILFLLTPLLHWLINRLAYRLKLKNVPW